MSDPARLRFVVLPTRSLPPLLQHGQLLFVAAVLLVAALWILAGFLTDPPEAGRRFLACSAMIGFGGVFGWTTWRTANEVIVEGDEVRWRGFVGRGRAPLSRLRRVRESSIGRNHIEFDFGRLRGFTISPADGLWEFVDRLQVRLPYLQVWLSPSVWRAARRHPGRFEETS